MTTLPRACLSCGTLVRGASRCPPCQAGHDAARGTTSGRGYGTAHQVERRRWTARIAAGEPVECARCHAPITAGMLWHLDHTDDRTDYLGPSHDDCNSGARR
jgi:hypothetical protein